MIMAQNNQEGELQHAPPIPYFSIFFATTSLTPPLSTCIITDYGQRCSPNNVTANFIPMLIYISWRINFQFSTLFDGFFHVNKA